MVLICGGGGVDEGMVMGVGREDTRYLIILAVDLMVDVDKLKN